ncbi:glutaredoxin-like protein NrdH [Paenarthrobacter nitroguajacolicus]|uniref:glutaredoxin-like protein NrdH n=1 Tax=Paenarthrobacter nitroguajacolicus TaxID=211146 RepID=UPI0006CFB066
MVITVYSKPSCVQCTLTKDWLEREGFTFKTIDISQDLTALEAVKALGYMGAPVVKVDERHWYGFRPDLLEELKSERKAA